MTLSLVYADPKDLYLYATLERAALKSQQQYVRVLNTIDSVIAIYEIEHEKLVRDCKKLRTEIFVNTKGMRDTQGADLPDTLYTERTMSETTTMLYLCKAVFRRLAQQLHPDRETGDEQLFQRVLQAYKKADIHQLRAIEAKVSSSKCLSWVKLEGIKFGGITTRG